MHGSQMMDSTMLEDVHRKHVTDQHSAKKLNDEDLYLCVSTDKFIIV